ncbi:tRNA selenocysteine 1-associated protein 1 [Nematostella vectensis]|uniref:tRNA selenocysteine 1-associated protein 1 n=1 Tax=Nematostella vectensis TaxID=45351 RepID=UPI001390476C|nr:tRNA selenocysteine 1-associated protein 1 [Nematostella vectensis]
MSTLWMGDLDQFADEAFVASAFAAMGESVASVKMIKNRITGGPAGYCFVDFGDTGTAQKVMSKLNGLPIPGSNPIKRFKLNWATYAYGKESTHQGPEFSIFVGDLTPDVNDHMLQEFFQSRFPSCKAAKVVLDASGNSRGYGFVRFFDEKEHKRAMVEMQGAVGCGSKPIRVSAATPKRPPTTTTYAATTEATPTVAAQYGTQYTPQQYQQYQQYMAAWQGYAQQQQQPYYQQYQQQYAAPVAYGQDYQQQHVVQGYETDQQGMTVDNTAEDPDEPLDIAEENKRLIERESELFEEFESSRWQPTESLTNSPKAIAT